MTPPEPQKELREEIHDHILLAWHNAVDKPELVTDNILTILTTQLEVARREERERITKAVEGLPIHNDYDDDQEEVGEDYLERKAVLAVLTTPN